jgi:hypothetical protein
VRDEGTSASIGAICQHVVANRAWGVVLVSVGTFVVGVLSTSVVGISHLLYAFAVPAGVLLGPVGAVGFAFGALCRDLLAGAPLSAAAVRAGGDVVFVAIGYAVWDWRSRPASDRRRSSALATYTVAVVVASLCSVAFLATGLALLGRAAFVTSLPILVTDRAVPALLLGPAVLYAATATVDVYSGPGRGNGPTTATILGVAVIALAWLVTGFALSIVRHDIAAFSSTRRNIAARLPDVFEPVFFAALGDLYVPFQMVGATVALFGIVILFVRDEYSVRTRGSVLTLDN